MKNKKAGFKSAIRNGIKTVFMGKKARRQIKVRNAAKGILNGWRPNQYFDMQNALRRAGGDKKVAMEALRLLVREKFVEPVQGGRMYRLRTLKKRAETPAVRNSRLKMVK